MKKVLFLIATLILISCGDKPKKENTVVVKKNVNLKEEYFDSGILKTRAKLKDGLEHGSYMTFHENQIIATSGIKIKGKMNGIWKYYNPLGEIMSVKHFYNDSVLYNLDTNDFNFFKKEIDEHMEIKVPSKWRIVKGIESEQVLLSIRKDCDKEMSFCPSLTITYEASISDETQISNYLKKSNDILVSSFNTYKVVKERNYVYEGQTYYEKIYTGSVQGINIGGITTWIFDKKNIYIITGLALNEKENPFLKQEGLFKEITNSVKLIN